MVLYGMVLYYISHMTSISVALPAAIVPALARRVATALARKLYTCLVDSILNDIPIGFNFFFYTTLTDTPPTGDRRAAGRYLFDCVLLTLLILTTMLHSRSPRRRSRR